MQYQYQVSKVDIASSESRTKVENYLAELAESECSIVLMQANAELTHLLIIAKK